MRKVLNLAILATLPAMSLPAHADDAALLRKMQAQMQQMQAQIAALQRRLKDQDLQQQEIATKVARQTRRAKVASKAVQVYGQARVSADHRSGDWPSGSEGTEIVSNASRLGVKGEMETALDETMLFYRAEVRYETTDFVAGGPGTTTGTKQLEFREGFAGLKGPWGSARMGRLSNNYKTTGTKIDPWTDNAPQARSGGRQGMSEMHSSYFNNAIEYVTPRLNGLQGNLWYSSRFDDSSKPIHNTSTLKNFLGGDAWGVGAKYTNGPFFLAADYLKIDADSITKAGLTNGDSWQIAGRAKVFKAFSVAAMYEDAEDLGLGRNAYVNGIYTLGRTRFIAAYGRNRDGAVYGNKDWNDWSLGVKYNLTKKSELLAAWNRRTDDTADKDFDTLTLGVNAKFGY